LAVLGIRYAPCSTKSSEYDRLVVIVLAVMSALENDPVVANTLVVVREFDTYTFPVTNSVVASVVPCMVAVVKLDTDATFRVVQFTNGTVNVLKRKLVVVAFEVNAFVTVSVLLTVTLFVETELENVPCVAKTFVVVRAFAE
jgi:hypothetical protein